MGCAADGLIYLAHLGGEFYRAAGYRVEFHLGVVQSAIVVRLAPNDVELTGSRTALRVLVVALASGCYGAATMKYFRQTELGLLSVVVIAHAQQLAGFGMLAEYVATLHHKVLDDAMKQQ